MARPVEKVAFAENVVTVHVAAVSEPGLLPDGSEAWDVESKVMVPGETLPLSSMPTYLREAIVGGKVPGLVAMTPAQAKRRVDTYNHALGIGSFPELDDEELDSEVSEDE